MSKDSLIKKIKELYIKQRLENIDKDFLEFEEEMIDLQDLEFILNNYKDFINCKIPNPYNSILLYITGCSDQFDHKKQRSYIKGGAPPDIDIDFDATERYKAINYAIEKWGRERVANIITHGTFKPKSLVRRYYKITEGNEEDLSNILKKIPPPQHGKEPDFKEVLKANPALLKEEKYKGFVNLAQKLEGMVDKFGIHAAGLVISDYDLRDLFPLWTKKDKQLNEDGKKVEVQQWITQFDMKEIEELGSIKFDFLSIDNLSILKETLRLLSLKGIEIDPWNLPQDDPKTATLLANGLLAGVFQMETSGSARKLIQKIQPKNIEELSDISSINRPGPLQAGFDAAYIENKQNAYSPAEMPEALAELLKNSYWCILYQEQVNNIAVY